MSVNYWFEHVIDRFLQACAEGRSAQEAVAEAEAAPRPTELRVLTQPDLRPRKGIRYSRQHLARLVDAEIFPRPFQLPTTLERNEKGWPRARAREAELEIRFRRKRLGAGGRKVSRAISAGAGIPGSPAARSRLRVREHARSIKVARRHPRVRPCASRR